MEQAQDVRLSISAGQANRAWQAGFPTVSSFDPRWMWIDAKTAFPRDARSKRTSFAFDVARIACKLEPRTCGNPSDPLPEGKTKGVQIPYVRFNRQRASVEAFSRPVAPPRGTFFPRRDALSPSLGGLGGATVPPPDAPHRPLPRLPPPERGVSAHFRGATGPWRYELVLDVAHRNRFASRTCCARGAGGKGTKQEGRRSFREGRDRRCEGRAFGATYRTKEDQPAPTNQAWEQP
eukprot:scaffold271_cov336-Pavlova_lutheri.AAC.39